MSRPSLYSRLWAAITGRALTWQQLAIAFGDVVVGSSIVTTTEAWKNPHVRACVEANSHAVASRPFKIYRDRDEVKSHWLLDLMKSPNKVLRLSGYDIKAQTVAIREIFGECFWFLQRGGQKNSGGKGPVSALWPYHPLAVREVIDRGTGELLAWDFQFENERMRIDPLDVLHFKRYDPLKHNPLRPSRGTSPLQSAMLAVSSDIAASKYNLDFFTRGVAPGIVLINKGDLGGTDEEQFVAKLTAKFAGKSGAPLVLDGEWDAKTLGSTQKDAEFNIGRDRNRADIMEVFKTPPVVLGNQDAKYDNAEQQLKIWWTIGLRPIMTNFCSTIDVGLLSKEPGLTCELTTEDVDELQKDKRERFKTAIELVKTRVPWDVADRVLDLGLGKFEGSDIAFGQFSDVPVEDLSATTRIQPGAPQIQDPGPAGTPPQDPATNPDANGDPQNSPPAKAKKMLEPIRVVTSIQTRTVEEDALIIATKIIRGDDAKLRALARRFHIQALSTGASQIADLLGVTSLVTVTNPYVIEFLNAKSNQIISVNETTADRIMELIRQMVPEGDTPEDIGRAIRDLYNLRDRQARLIGRQEVGSALNGGRYIEMTEERVTDHEWLSSRDDRVREDHEKEDGNVVHIGDRFPVTNLRYPQDPDGPAKQVIGCRCITLPVTNGERALINDPAAYWRAAMKQTRSMESGFSAKLQKYLNDQRAAVLGALAQIGVAA